MRQRNTKTSAANNLAQWASMKSMRGSVHRPNQPRNGNGLSALAPSERLQLLFQLCHPARQQAQHLDIDAHGLRAKLALLGPVGKPPPPRDKGGAESSECYCRSEKAIHGASSLPLNHSGHAASSASLIFTSSPRARPRKAPKRT